MPLSMRIDHGLASLIAARDTLSLLAPGDLGEDLLDALNNITAWAQAWYGQVGPEPYDNGAAMRAQFQAFLKQGHEDISVLGEKYVPTILKTLEAYLSIQADMASCYSASEAATKGLPPMQDMMDAYHQFVSAYIDTITSPAARILPEVELELG